MIYGFYIGFLPRKEEQEHLLQAKINHIHLKNSTTTIKHRSM